MSRREFLSRAGAAGLAAAVTGLPALPARAQARFAPQPGAWQTYEVTTRIELTRPAGVARAWIPLPSVDEPGWVRNLGDEWTGNASRARLASDGVYHARMVAAEWAPGVDVAVLSATSRFATRDRAVDLGKGRAAAPLDAATARFYTAPTELIRTDGIVRATAQKIVATAKSDEARARAIYDWICERTSRNPKTRGCGLGDVTAMLESGDLSGKCADLNALYVGLARAVGLPARDVYGLRVAPSAFGYRSLGAGTANVTRAQHCRAEVFLARHGWVPVDPADVRKVILEEPPGTLTLADAKVKDARQALFGAWEMNWLPYNTAHDVALPGARGAKLPFLMYPQAETASGRLDELDPDNFKYTITARSLAS
ncbi:MAG: transglutaminase-like domain-containing protein [Lautropia sp.]